MQELHAKMSLLRAASSFSSEQRRMIVPPDLRRLVVSGTIAVVACFGPARFHAVSAGEPQTEDRRNEAERVYRDEVTPFLKTYCVRCHGSGRAKGGVRFTNIMKRPEAGEFRRQWQTALANVREHD